jgi:hypothetical protein
LRRRTPEERQAMRLFGDRARRIVHRERAIVDDWLQQASMGVGDERLANAAAVARWQSGRLTERLEHLAPPPSCESAHRDITEAILDVTRGFQLLASGYRFRATDAVCDGQALLNEAMDDAERALRWLTEAAR